MTYRQAAYRRKAAEKEAERLGRRIVPMTPADQVALEQYQQTPEWTFGLAPA